VVRKSASKPSPAGARVSACAYYNKRSAGASVTEALSYLSNKMQFQTAFRSGHELLHTKSQLKLSNIQNNRQSSTFSKGISALACFIRKTPLMKHILAIVATCSLLCAPARANAIIIDPYIRLLKDSAATARLVSALDSFLASAQRQTEENIYVFPDERIETFVLLDEVAEMERSGKYKNEHFYKPYLTGITQLADSSYLVKVSYIGVRQDTAMLRASFSFVAHHRGNFFSFSAPLKRNTRRWKVVKMLGAILHFKDSFDKAGIAAYIATVRRYDKKLGQKEKLVELYLSDDAVELQQLMGVDYKRDYNGQTEKTFTSIFGGRQLTLAARRNGHFDFDPHDLWHARLAMAKLNALTYRPVDEGCAYLYGGSWGISWQDIYKRFKAKVAADRSIEWQAVKEKPLNFSDDEQQPLLADYVVNALIVQRLEQEHGFKAVATLLGCGKIEPGHAAYYDALERLTGITKNDYNNWVWQLIDNYRL
jgi:hypothetical protein